MLYRGNVEYMDSPVPYIDATVVLARYVLSLSVCRVSLFVGHSTK
jgi:hypothetical protein